MDSQNNESQTSIESDVEVVNQESMKKMKKCCDEGTLHTKTQLQKLLKQKKVEITKELLKMRKSV